MRAIRNVKENKISKSNTYGHGQQCGDAGGEVCVEVEKGIEGINGDEKKNPTL